MINNIKEFFPKVIQKRGLDYEKQGRVKDVFKDGKYYHANILGTSCYHTVIEVEDDKIVSGYCECEAYKDSKSCKHMASLSYYINNHKIKENRTIEDVLKGLSKEELLKVVDLLLKNDKNREMVSFNFLENLDEVIPSIKYYLNFLIKNNLENNKEYKERLLDILLKLASSDLARSYLVLEIILEYLGSSFKVEALRFIDISSIYYTNTTSISLITRLLEIDYLKLDLITILIKNDKKQVLNDILLYLDKKSINSLKDKLVKLKILLVYSEKKACSYARDNLKLDKEFLRVYLSLESDPAEVLLTYLMNYDDSFLIKKSDLVDAILETKNQDAIMRMNDFL